MILLTTTYFHCLNVCCRSHIHIQRNRNIGELPHYTLLYTVYYSLQARTKRNETDQNKKKRLDCMLNGRINGVWMYRKLDEKLHVCGRVAEWPNGSCFLHTHTKKL